MEFAFLDESGDPGEKGSNYLILTLMCTSRKKEIVKIIVDAKQKLLRATKGRKWLNKRGGEIKYYGFPDTVLLHKVLENLSKVDINIYFMAFKKEGKPVDNSNRPFILYELFRHIFNVAKNQKPHEIFADVNFFNKEKVNRFILNSYVKKPINIKEGSEEIRETEEISFSKIDDEEYDKIKEDKSKVIITIEHRNSKLSEELQALDLIGGSIYRNFESKDSSLIDILKNGKIRIEGVELEKGVTKPPYLSSPTT